MCSTAMSRVADAWSACAATAVAAGRARGARRSCAAQRLDPDRPPGSTRRHDAVLNQPRAANRASRAQGRAPAGAPRRGCFGRASTPIAASRSDRLCGHHAPIFGAVLAALDVDAGRAARRLPPGGRARDPVRGRAARLSRPPRCAAPAGRSLAAARRALDALARSRPSPTPRKPRPSSTCPVALTTVSTRGCSSHDPHELIDTTDHAHATIIRIIHHEHLDPTGPGLFGTRVRRAHRATSRRARSPSASAARSAAARRARRSRCAESCAIATPRRRHQRHLHARRRRVPHAQRARCRRRRSAPSRPAAARTPRSARTSRRTSMRSKT